MKQNRASIPDQNRLRAVEKLCSIKEQFLDDKETCSLFVEAMKEITLWHHEKSVFYRRLMNLKRFDIEKLKTIEDCSAIPFVLAEFFKQHEVLSIPKENVHLHLTSSGTTGQKSQVFLDEWSVGSAQGMLDAIFETNGWVTPQTPANYLLYSYEPEPQLKLGTSYTDHYLCKYAPVANTFVALRRDGKGSHEFDVYGAIAALKQYADQKLPVRIFGFPAFLHFTLERMAALGEKPLHLQQDSFVFLGGGWKGHAEKAIPKKELYDATTRLLGIPNERIRDGFGSVEHSIPYVECRGHNFHVPTWARVFIRDFRTLEVLPFGKAGFLHFVSPYITSMPAHSIMMGDSASMYPGKQCGCGVTTPFFVIHGRAGTSKNKSCALAASELLKRFA